MEDMNFQYVTEQCTGVKKVNKNYGDNQLIRFCQKIAIHKIHVHHFVSKHSADITAYAIYMKLLCEHWESYSTQCTHCNGLIPSLLHEISHRKPHSIDGMMNIQTPCSAICQKSCMSKFIILLGYICWISSITLVWCYWYAARMHVSKTFTLTVSQAANYTQAYCSHNPSSQIFMDCYILLHSRTNFHLCILQEYY